MKIPWLSNLADKHLKNRISIYQKALETYADPDNWATTSSYGHKKTNRFNHDPGYQIAQDALNFFNHKENNHDAVE